MLGNRLFFDFPNDRIQPAILAALKSGRLVRVTMVTPPRIGTHSAGVVECGAVDQYLIVLLGTASHLGQHAIDRTRRRCSTTIR